MTWRLATVALIGFTISCARPVRLAHLVDLSQTLSPDFPFIPANGKTFAFRITPIATLADSGVNANKWELTEHNGTHVDAPIHFVAHRASVEQLPLEALVVPVAVIDLRSRVAVDADASLRIDDVLHWEAAHGRLPDHAALFVLTGWDRRAGDAQAFLNMDAKGVMHFPGIEATTVAFLVAERRIAGIGIDTLSIDPGPDLQYHSHRQLFEAGKWAAECMTHLDQLPPAGATAMVGVMKVLGATGAPARIIAFW